MLLRRGDVRGFDFNRMVVEFTMLNQDQVIPCAISTVAMDDLEDKRDVKPDQRVDQFMQLRELFASKHHVSSSKNRSGPTDPWYYDPMISP